MIRSESRCWGGLARAYHLLPKVLSSASVMWVLQSDMQRVVVTKVVPALECERGACFGERLVPLLVDEQFAFVAFFEKGIVVMAWFKMLRVIDAAVREGAPGRDSKRWGLICMESFVYRVPLRFPTRKFDFCSIRHIGG